MHSLHANQTEMKLDSSFIKPTASNASRSSNQKDDPKDVKCDSKAEEEEEEEEEEKQARRMEADRTNIDKRFFEPCPEGIETGIYSLGFPEPQHTTILRQHVRYALFLRSIQHPRLCDGPSGLGNLSEDGELILIVAC